MAVNNKPEYSLKKLSAISLDVQLKWTLGLMAWMLGVTKKRLRKAYAILRNPELEAEILVRKKLVKKTFQYGFRSFEIIKKGKRRKILAPHPDVQEIFVKVKNWLENNPCGQGHRNAFGFVKDRNCKKAFLALLPGGRHIIGFDISDAFPSITAPMVEEALLGDANIFEALAKPLTWLCTYDYDGQRRLPQGASSSPLLLNLVYRSMCDEIDEICKENKIAWAVYADDFSFSAQGIYPEIKRELLSVPEKYDFKIKPEKTRDNRRKSIPHVLGMFVRDGEIHIDRKKKNEFRRILFAAKNGMCSKEKATGIARYIGHIYGEEKNWPGWLLRPWLELKAQIARVGKK